MRNAAEHVHSWGRLDPRIGTGIASAIRVTASDEVASAVLESPTLRRRGWRTWMSQRHARGSKVGCRNGALIFAID